MVRKFLSLMACLLWISQASAAEINTQSLNLTEEQNQKLTELREKLKAEIQPIWDEIQSGRERITEIEKRYFEEFWNMLSDEQKEQFTKLNQ